MPHKNIKLTIRKQLKKEFPNWKHLPEKMKREISNKVMDEITADQEKHLLRCIGERKLPIKWQHKLFS